jgi:hypothetical protein
MKLRDAIFFSCLACSSVAAAWAEREPGLLFYWSGNHGLAADFAAGGDTEPNFANDQVKVLPGGIAGPYLQCGGQQVLSYWAPGNIFAQRGTHVDRHKRACR